jgi:hypothetical protein
MIKCFFIVCLALASCLHAGVDDDWFDPAFVEANTAFGGTGFITVPSPEVVPQGELDAAIHLYQVAIGYGLWNYFEFGFSANLEDFEVFSDTYSNELFYAKMRLLSVEKEGIGLSIGCEGLGLNDFGIDDISFVPKARLFVPKASLVNMEHYYVVAGAPLPFYPSLMVTAGYIGGEMTPSGFFNVSKVLIPGMLGMLEYDGVGTNVGARFLLSPSIKLDVDFINTQSVERGWNDWSQFSDVLHDNINFGITYTEPWSLSLAYFMPTGTPDAAKSSQAKP